MRGCSTPSAKAADPLTVLRGGYVLEVNGTSVDDVQHEDSGVASALVADEQPSDPDARDKSVYVTCITGPMKSPDCVEYLAVVAGWRRRFADVDHEALLVTSLGSLRRSPSSPYAIELCAPGDLGR